MYRAIYVMPIATSSPKNAQSPVTVSDPRIFLDIFLKVPGAHSIKTPFKNAIHPIIGMTMNQPPVNFQ